MSSNSYGLDEDRLAGFAAVVPPAPGGTLAEYAAFLRTQGRPVFLPDHGRWVWVPGERGILNRLPLECLEPPDEAEVCRAVSNRGVWLCTYQDHATPERPANCLNYVCADPAYDLEHLPSKVRNKVRRGLRSFTIRLCSWDELVAKGSAAYVDTLARYGDLRGAETSLRAYAEAQRGQSFYDIWGAWLGDQLAAWTTVLKIDDWAMVNVCRSLTESLRLAPNNALRFAFTRHLLVTEGRALVSSGLSSLRADGHEMGIHSYKTSMGFAARPVRRCFAAHPLIRPVLEGRAGAWVLERLARAAPGVATLRKAAVLARLMSGREANPLGWVADE